ncbi:MAG: YhdT family protein [Firmicutes bacterium]|nr:YhdT family protein [Bacillota bacterium]
MKETNADAPEKAKRTRRKSTPADGTAKKQNTKRNSARAKREMNEWIGREAFVALSVVMLFFLWWVLALYRDVPKRTYILGMPEWFFYGAMVGTALFVIAVWAVVRALFRELEPDVKGTAKKRKRAVAKAKADAMVTMEGEGDWAAAAASALAAKNASLAIEEVVRSAEMADDETEDAV